MYRDQNILASVVQLRSTAQLATFTIGSMSAFVTGRAYDLIGQLGERCKPSSESAPSVRFGRLVFSRSINASHQKRSVAFGARSPLDAYSRSILHSLRRYLERCPGESGQGLRSFQTAPHDQRTRLRTDRPAGTHNHHADTCAKCSVVLDHRRRSTTVSDRFRLLVCSYRR